MLRNSLPSTATTRFFSCLTKEVRNITGVTVTITGKLKDVIDRELKKVTDKPSVFANDLSKKLYNYRRCGGRCAHSWFMNSELNCIK